LDFIASTTRLTSIYEIEHYNKCGEFKANCFLCYDEPFIEEKEAFEKKIVKFIFIFEFFSIVSFIVNFYSLKKFV